MGWKVIFAPQALEELEQLVRFVADDDAQAAVRFGDYLLDRAESLANMPELGTRIVKEPMFDACYASPTTFTIAFSGPNR